MFVIKCHIHLTNKTHQKTISILSKYHTHAEKSLARKYGEKILISKKSAGLQRLLIEKKTF